MIRNTRELISLQVDAVGGTGHCNDSYDNQAKDAYLDTSNGYILIRWRIQGGLKIIQLSQQVHQT